jgi:hypothetical protein
VKRGGCHASAAFPTAAFTVSPLELLSKSPGDGNKVAR